MPPHALSLRWINPALVLFVAILVPCRVASADDEAGISVAIVVNDTTQAIPRKSLGKIRDAIAEPLQEAKIDIAPDEDAARVICDITVACDPPMVRERASYEMYLSLKFWDAKTGRLRAERNLTSSGSSSYSQLADLVYAKLIAPANGLQRELPAMRILEGEESRVSLPENTRSWFVPNPKNQKGLVHITLRGAPFEAGCLETTLLRELDGNGWVACRSSKQANALLSCVVTKKARKERYTLNGTVSSEINVYDLTATFSIGSGSKPMPTAEWSVKGSTPYSFKSSDGGSDGAALKDLQERFDARIKGSLVSALNATSEPIAKVSPKKAAKQKPKSQPDVTKSAAPKPPEKDREAVTASKLKLARKLLDSNREEALKRLQELVKEFPGTAAADEARKILESP